MMTLSHFVEFMEEVMIPEVLPGKIDGNREKRQPLPLPFFLEVT